MITALVIVLGIAWSLLCVLVGRFFAEKID